MNEEDRQICGTKALTAFLPQTSKLFMRFSLPGDSDIFTGQICFLWKHDKTWYKIIHWNKLNKGHTYADRWWTGPGKCTVDFKTPFQNVSSDIKLSWWGSEDFYLIDRLTSTVLNLLLNWIINLFSIYLDNNPANNPPVSPQNVGDHALLIFARNCPNIETLDLGGCGKLTDHTSHSLARHAAKLTRWHHHYHYHDMTLWCHDIIIIIIWHHHYEDMTMTWNDMTLHDVTWSDMT